MSSYLHFHIELAKGLGGGVNQPHFHYLENKLLSWVMGAFPSPYSLLKRQAQEINEIQERPKTKAQNPEQATLGSIEGYIKEKEKRGKWKKIVKR